MRLAKEQVEVGSSLFAQPLMLAPVPLEGEDPAGTAVRESPAAKSEAVTNASAEERMLAAVAQLEHGSGANDMTELGDHLAMLKRWYYRPEKQRAGAIFFRERGSWPVRRMVRAAARLALAASQPAQPERATPASAPNLSLT